MLCLVLWAALWFGLRGREVPLYKLGRPVAGVAVTSAAVLVVLANCWPNFPSLGRLDDLLIFNDDWGTYRGTAWRITAASWLAQPLWRKLFGVGPGMMHTAVAEWAVSYTHLPCTNPTNAPQPLPKASAMRSMKVTPVGVRTATSRR